MGLSRYPRIGQRIAPAILHDVLNVEIPLGFFHNSAGKFRTLANLDESIWQTTSEKTCEQLAALVVKEVHRNLRRLPVMVRISTLPTDVSKIPLAELEIQVRTFNALKKRFGNEISTETKIRDLIGISDFGARSIVDLLVSVEAYSICSRQAQQLDLKIQAESAAAVSLDDYPSRIDVEISHYPRRGHRIAPKTLKNLLCIPCGDRRLANLLLCDLDESMWDRLSTQLRNKLSDAVIKRVKVFRGALRNQAGQIKLPMPQTKGKSIVLQLEQRTFNCLHERGLFENPALLAQLTITDLMAMSGFGEKSVVDLLSSLESQMTEAHVATPEVLALVQKLSRIKDAGGIRTDDPRFGLALQALRIRGKTLQEICETILADTSCPMSAELFVCRLEELHSSIQAAHRITLEEELFSLTAFEPNSRNREMAIKHFGWAGTGRETLEAVGSIYETTRERVRQICKKQLEALEKKSPFLPVLDRVLNLASETIPCPVENLQQVLFEKKLTGEKFNLEGIIHACEHTGRKCSFVIQSEGNASFAAANTENIAGFGASLVQIARRAVSHWGVTTVADVAAQVIDSNGKPIRTDFAKKILQCQNGFSWLDEAAGWFWIKTGRNSLLTQIKKVLSVCNRIHISELREGVSRHHRREGFAPPQRVLLALCNQTGECKVEENFVAAAPPLSLKEILSEAERKIVEVLLENGSVMERQKLEDECLARGVKRDTFYVYLTYSPALARFAPGVYGTRGAEIPPGYAKSLVAMRKKKTRVLSDFGWMPDGKIFLSYKLSKGTLSNGIVSVPSGMKQHLLGSHELQVSGGMSIGRLVVKDSQAWGLGPLFTRRGGDLGDSLRILFDLETKIAIAELGQTSMEEADEVTMKL
jgi:hypothetical protein